MATLLNLVGGLVVVALGNGLLAYVGACFISLRASRSVKRRGGSNVQAGGTALLLFLPSSFGLYVVLMLLSALLPLPDEGLAGGPILAFPAFLGLVAGVPVFGIIWWLRGRDPASGPVPAPTNAAKRGVVIALLSAFYFMVFWAIVMSFIASKTPR